MAAKAATGVETAMFSSRGGLLGGWDVCVCVCCVVVVEEGEVKGMNGRASERVADAWMGGGLGKMAVGGG